MRQHIRRHRAAQGLAARMIGSNAGFRAVPKPSTPPSRRMWYTWSTGTYHHVEVPMQTPRKRHPNATCVVCGRGFYAAPSVHRETCSMAVPDRELPAARPAPDRSGDTGAELSLGRRSVDSGSGVCPSPIPRPSSRRSPRLRPRASARDGAGTRPVSGAGEVVHHRNHVRDDNRPENLQLYGSNADHKRSEHRRDLLR